MIFIQSINEIQAEVNSLDNDLAVLLLVIQGLGRVQAPWIDLRGNITYSFFPARADLVNTLCNQKIQNLFWPVWIKNIFCFRVFSPQKALFKFG